MGGRPLPGRRSLLRLAAGLLLAAAGLRSVAAREDGQPRTTTVVIVTGKGRFPFTVEVAMTPEQRRVGLMGRTGLPASGGMLFDYGQPGPVRMWMKDTLISLDMLFIDETGRVVHVAERTTPFSLQPLGPDQPVLAVLEVAAGTAARLGITAGSRVEHPRFAASAPR